MKRILIAGMIVTGISMVAAVLGAVIAPDLLGEPGGFVTLFASVFVAISGLFGGKIGDWADTLYGKKKEERRRSCYCPTS